jgi:hypothetical protein
LYRCRRPPRRLRHRHNRLGRVGRRRGGELDRDERRGGDWQRVSHQSDLGCGRARRAGKLSRRHPAGGEYPAGGDHRPHHRQHKYPYSGTGGGAFAGPDAGLYESYSSIRSDLINAQSPGETIFNTLPAGSSIQGQSSVAVWNSQLKLLEADGFTFAGAPAANDTTSDDGSATFATDINPSLLVGAALHELGHALGRVPYGPQPDIFDLFRFTSAGTRLFTGGATAPAAYFSLDGGNTKVAESGGNHDENDAGG